LMPSSTISAPMKIAAAASSQKRPNAIPITPTVAAEAASQSARFMAASAWRILSLSSSASGILARPMKYWGTPVNARAGNIIQPSQTSWPNTSIVPIVGCSRVTSFRTDSTTMYPPRNTRAIAAQKNAIDWARW
jgi:hypothetical protein